MVVRITASWKTLALVGLFLQNMGHCERLGRSVLAAVYTTYTACVNMYMYRVFGEEKNCSTAWCPGTANQASASATDSPPVPFRLRRCCSRFICCRLADRPRQPLCIGLSGCTLIPKARPRLPASLRSH